MDDFTWLNNININYCTAFALARNKDSFIKRKALSLFDTGEVMGQSEMMVAYCVSSIWCVSGVVRLIIRIVHWLNRTLFSNCGNVVENHTCHTMSHALSGVTLRLRRHWNWALSIPMGISTMAHVLQ